MGRYLLSVNLVGILILGCICLNYAFGKSATGVVDLNGKTFDMVVSNNSYVLVLFYAPWCYWSRLMMNDYHAASLKLQGHNPPIVLARLDAVAEAEIAEIYHVQSYPVLKFFADKHKISYTGGRTANEIVNWINRALDRDHVIPSKDELENFLNHNDLRVLGVFPTGTDAVAFQHVARLFSDVLFGETSISEAQAVLEKLDSSLSNLELPCVVFFTAHQPKVAIYRGSITNQNELLKFVNTYKNPAVTVFDQHNAAKLFSEGRPILFYVRDSSTGSHSSEHIAAEAAFTTVAQNRTHSNLFAITGNSEMYEKRLLDLLGVDDDVTLPAIRLAESNPHSNGYWRPAHKYMFNQEINSNLLHKWLAQYHNKEIGAYLKSEPVPVPAEAGEIMDIVGSTFPKLVVESKKDVLVAFYAPWCGHCRKLGPIWKQLANTLVDVPSVLVARMDATQNEVDEVEVEAYPTIYFFPAKISSETPRHMLYPATLERTPDALLDFLSKNANIPFNLNDMSADSNKTEELFEEL
eukprot:Platyproteum_vivax@DN6755_c0_g1_i1.p1